MWNVSLAQNKHYCERLQTLTLSLLAWGLFELRCRTHFDKIGQTGLKLALVGRRWFCNLHRELQTWSSCWVGLLPITPS